MAALPRTTRRLRALGATLAPALLSISTTAEAILVEYSFVVEIVATDPAAPADEMLFGVGDDVTGSFVIDTDAEPLPSSNRDYGVTLLSYGITLGATAQVPGFSSLEVTADPPSLGIYDDHVCTEAPSVCFPPRAGPTDEFDYGSDFRDTATGYEVDVDFHILQTAPFPTLIESLAVPVEAPDLAMATETGGRIKTLRPGAADFLFWPVRVTHLEARVVPEPFPTLLVAVSALALCAVTPRPSRSPRPRWRPRGSSSGTGRRSGRG